MLSIVSDNSRTGAGRAFAHNPSARGYIIVYRPEETNHCPGCGRTHWYVGRLSAECAFCSTAIPLADAVLQGNGGHSRNRKMFEPSAFAA